MSGTAISLDRARTSRALLQPDPTVHGGEPAGSKQLGIAPVNGIAAQSMESGAGSALTGPANKLFWRLPYRLRQQVFAGYVRNFPGITSGYLTDRMAAIRYSPCSSGAVCSPRFSRTTKGRTWNLEASPEARTGNGRVGQTALLLATVENRGITVRQSPAPTLGA